MCGIAWWWYLQCGALRPGGALEIARGARRSSSAGGYTGKTCARARRARYTREKPGYRVIRDGPLRELKANRHPGTPWQAGGTTRSSPKTESGGSLLRHAADRHSGWQRGQSWVRQAWT